MAWRTSDDPRCPECDEKIAGTAQYCMHCEADLPDGPTGEPASSASGEIDSDPTPTDDYGGVSDTPDGGERTTLLLRGPISIVMAFPAALLALFGVTGIPDTLPWWAALTVLLVSLVGVAGYLLTKPLASDAIGDGLYIYGGLFVVIPLLWMVGDLGRLVLGTGTEVLADILVVTVLMEVGFAVPAVICFLLGYLANTYARRKLESALDDRHSA